MNVNKTDINYNWHTFLQLATEAKMRNSGLNKINSQKSTAVNIDKKSLMLESKKYLPLSPFNNRYTFTEDKDVSKKILGTKFDAYA